MQPDEFPANSFSSRKEIDDKRVERVTSTDPIRKKKSLGKKFTETFVAGDLKSAVGYGVLDIMLPMVRDTIVDVITGTVEKLFMGDRRRGGSTPPQSGQYGNVQYTNYAIRGMGGGASRLPSSMRAMSRAARSQHDFDEVVLASRNEAEQVIDQLFEVVNRYGTATVADLYELVGLASNYTDTEWGWTNLQGAGVTRNRDGYLLDLPNPHPVRGKS